MILSRAASGVAHRRIGSVFAVLLTSTMHGEIPLLSIVLASCVFYEKPLTRVKVKRIKDWISSHGHSRINLLKCSQDYDIKAPAQYLAVTWPLALFVLDSQL